MFKKLAKDIENVLGMKTQPSGVNILSAVIEKDLLFHQDTIFMCRSGLSSFLKGPELSVCSIANEMNELLQNESLSWFHMSPLICVRALEHLCRFATARMIQELQYPRLPVLKIYLPSPQDAITSY